jgi:zinc protease
MVRRLAVAVARILAIPRFASTERMASSLAINSLNLQEMVLFFDSMVCRWRSHSGAIFGRVQGSFWQARLLGLALVISLPAQASLPIEHWQQPSGARVYLVRSPSIPMLDVQIDFDAGQRREPRDKVGLASAMANLLSKGVLARGQDPALDENQITEAWVDLGASFGASAGADRLSFSLRTLTEPDLMARAVAMAARQLGEPSFSDRIWQRERQRYIADLQESYTRPATVAGRRYVQAIYGDHPYGHQMTEQTLQRVSTEDMRRFYADHVGACRARVSLVGAVDRARADALVRQLLSRLPDGACAGARTLPPVPEVAPLAAAQDLRIAFKAAQAQVLMGQPGFKRSDPDFFALTVGNYILGGGGFVSRLTREVRELRGLSYSVYSYFSPGLHAGSFTVGLSTRPDQATQALEVARQVVRDFVAQGPTEDELRQAKQSLVSGFVLRLDSNARLLENVANIAWHDLPLDYLSTWTSQVERLTTADIRAAFARKLQPERMVTVLLGGAS